MVAGIEWSNRAGQDHLAVEAFEKIDTTDLSRVVLQLTGFHPVRGDMFIDR